MRETFSKRPRVRVIFFARNFGHQIAVTAGMDHALGDAAINRCDLQDPPEVILGFNRKMKGRYEVVYAVRTGRRRGRGLKKETASIFIA
jgi:dolichol-phosphate mannosyltransferase